VSGNSPIKVAIIGGGVAGITAAFDLTRPEQRGRYAVTLYQVGWRLGGKGASGRGAHDRIEEHGLHLWMGFYENAFRTMRECYEELGRDPARCPIATWRDAFVADHFSGIADWSPSGRWLPWRVNMPPFEGLPGDPNPPPRWTIAQYLTHALTLVRKLLEAAPARVAEGPVQPLPSGSRPPEFFVEAMGRFMKLGQLASLTALAEALNVMEVFIGAPPRQPENVFLRFHDSVAAVIRGQLEAVVGSDDESRRLWEIADLVLAVVRGSFQFGLLTRKDGFDSIDGYDCREWLLLNGASKRAVNSGFVRALYDLAFAYEGGDPSRPRIAAGQALRGALRAFLTYRGAFFWKMQGGMGDIVFAPYYEVLARRGVRFEFFHRIERLRLSPPDPNAPGERPHVAAIDIDVQADVRQGSYQPLVDVQGLPCWPAEPDWSQLADGERLRDEGVAFESHWDTRSVRQKTLEVGRDFDLVIVAVGVGAVADVCRELVERDDKWRAMATHVKSVPTQAFQIWLSGDMKELGWTEEPINVSGFINPFDTWADMTHLVRRERWPSSPRAIAYFCSVLPDAPAEAQDAPGYAAARKAEVRQSAIRFLERDVRHLWPRANGPSGHFRWDLVVSPSDQADLPADESRFDGQFWTANVNPSDRYALSLPGTLEHRISPLYAGIDNLTVAGDWTSCGFNEGCVEAASMSGRLAANALSGLPRLDDIHGYDHP
jgi:uncharacterized protein with NAD-binding domain and iron-sulfur cluster